LLHCSVNCIVQLSVGDVLRFESELVESAPQTISTRPARLTGGSRMGIESHNADFFVIAQITPEQVFYGAPS
jgi:hypothetical protein